jgi:putative endonuclease
MSFYVYVLKSVSDGKFYTGCTNDLRKRFNQHKKGQVISTMKRLPLELIYYEMCQNQEDAYNRAGMGKRYIKNRLKGFLSLTG